MAVPPKNNPKVVLNLSGELWREDRPMTAVAVKLRLEIDEPLDGLAGEHPTSAAQVRLNGKLASGLAPEVIAACKALLIYLKPPTA